MGDLFKFLWTVSARVEPSNNGAHACTGNIIDGDSLFIKSLEDANL